MKKGKSRKLLSSITLSLALLFTSISPALASDENINPSQTTSISQSASSTNPLKVSKVTLNEKSITINVGSSETLIPTVLPSTATNQAVTWKSSKTSVATVDSNGKVTGVNAGKATITVTTVDGKKKATCKVTVPTIKVTGISLNKSSTTIYVGDTEKLKATFSPLDASNQKVSWKSSNRSIAAVDSNGNVTGIKNGTAIITVTTVDGKKNAKCTVTINAIPSIEEVKKNILGKWKSTDGTSTLEFFTDGTVEQYSYLNGSTILAYRSTYSFSSSTRIKMVTTKAWDSITKVWTNFNWTQTDDFELDKNQLKIFNLGGSGDYVFHKI